MGPLSESDNVVTLELLLRWAKILRSFEMEYALMHSEHKFKSLGQNSMDLVSLCFIVLFFDILTSNMKLVGGGAFERYLGHDGICVFMNVYQISIILHCARTW